MLKDMLIDPTQELIEKYRKEGKIIEIDKVSRSKEIKAINDFMDEFSGRHVFK